MAFICSFFEVIFKKIHKTVLNSLLSKRFNSFSCSLQPFDLGPLVYSSSGSYYNRTD